MFFVLLFLGKIIPYIASTLIAYNSGDRNAALLLAVICTGMRLAGPWLLFADTSTDFHFHLKFAIHFHHIYKYINHVIGGGVLDTGLCRGDINLQGVALHLSFQYLDYGHVKYPSTCQPEE